MQQTGQGFLSWLRQGVRGLLFLLYFVSVVSHTATHYMEDWGRGDQGVQPYGEVSTSTSSTEPSAATLSTQQEREGGECLVCLMLAYVGFAMLARFLLRIIFTHNTAYVPRSCNMSWLLPHLFLFDVASPRAPPFCAA